MKNLGFTNIKIYNGGVKDWQKSGFAIEQLKPLPEAETTFIDTTTFYDMLQDFDTRQCVDDKGSPLLTIVDFRNANHIKTDKPVPQLVTQCKIIHLLLDDVQDKEKRDLIPRETKVVSISETGNRDEFLIGYLSQYDYSNIVALRFGMRGWLKHRYPTR